MIHSQNKLSLSDQQGDGCYRYLFYFILFGKFKFMKQGTQEKSQGNYFSRIYTNPIMVYSIVIFVSVLNFF